jgi:hypothetical protein
MISNIAIGAFVFGAVLLLISLLGGKFKIFGAEIPGTVGRIGRFIAGAAGVFFILVALIVSLPLKTANLIAVNLLDYKTRKIVDDLAVHFNLPPENGHALYFSGEVKRIKDIKHFTSKGCIRTPFTEGFNLDGFHNDMYRYLNIAASLPKNKIGGVGSTICYERVNGYCLERIAWINHLLANDLYAEALASSDPKTKHATLEKALEHAKAAFEYQPPNERTPGFNQCTPTKKLINDISDAL